MSLVDELHQLFRLCLPSVVREEATARRLLGDPENLILERRDENGSLIAALVAAKNAVYLLCVHPDHRRRGLGSALLAEAENAIRAQGYGEILIGAGEDYLAPGVPTSVMPYPESLASARIDPALDDSACSFFRRRGFEHAWGACNCFDMRMDLAELPACPQIGSEIDGIFYRWAVLADRPAICTCTDDAHEPFTKYYMDEVLYNKANSQRVLIALDGSKVCGTLIVSAETEAPGLGSVGCTAVAHAWRGRHIAANMILLGSRYLRDLGLKNGFLGYTYSGLDKLYGLAGYRICTYYLMAAKKLR